MTVLLHDANILLKQDFPVSPNSVCCDELVYADDTLLIGKDSIYLQTYMHHIAQVGKTYGLSFNWKKVEQMNINCADMNIYSSDNEIIQVKECLKYLCAQLHADGHLETEIAQKLGIASQEFRNLKRI